MHTLEGRYSPVRKMKLDIINLCQLVSHLLLTLQAKAVTLPNINF